MHFHINRMSQSHKLQLNPTDNFFNNQIWNCQIKSQLAHILIAHVLIIID